MGFGINQKRNGNASNIFICWWSIAALASQSRSRGSRNRGFFIETVSGTTRGRKRTIDSLLGQLSISEKQAPILEVKAYTRWSPYVEKCCLLLSANESYQRAAEAIQMLTGGAVAHSTQQRLVQHQTFELPHEETAVAEISVDGGKVRLRTPKGEPSEWRD